MARVKAINEDLTKDSRKSAEVRKLRALFKNVSKDKIRLVESLIDNAAWQIVKLQELQEIIDREGMVEIYQNGANQSGRKKSPEAELYNVMIKNFSSLMKQLTDLIPESKLEDSPQIDDFDKFINSRD
jgi:hypothetical protein